MENTLPTLTGQQAHGKLPQLIGVLSTTVFDIGSCLSIVKSTKYYETLGYSEFDDYCQAEYNFKWRHAYQQIKAYETYQELRHGAKTIEVMPQSERQTRELAKAPPEEQGEVWVETQERTGKEQPTAKQVKETVEMKKHGKVGENYVILFKTYDESRLKSSLSSSEIYSELEKEFSVSTNFISTLLTLRNKGAIEVINKVYNKDIPMAEAIRLTKGFKKVRKSKASTTENIAVKHIREGYHYAIDYDEFKSESFQKYIKNGGIKKNDWIKCEHLDLMKNPFEYEFDNNLRKAAKLYKDIWLNKSYRPVSIDHLKSLQPKILISDKHDGYFLAGILADFLNK